MDKNLKNAVWASVFVVLGMLVGFSINFFTFHPKNPGMNNNLRKFNDVVKFINQNYMDEVDNDEMIEDAINGIMDGLDPHSSYIPKKKFEHISEEMNGSFEGIGIEFNILNDTLYVVSAISGGPSEQKGIMAGDRIIKVDGKDITGKKISNEKVIKLLRGKKGSKVILTIKRPGKSKTIDFEVTRDKIPLYSVDYSYMLSKNIGYIKISRFAETTHQEFLEALIKLKAKGMKNLVLDLRSNPGGYMDEAQKIADEFIPDNKLIVSTKGRTPQSNSEYLGVEKYKAFEKGGLVVLLDYGSASASEIVSGAIQDWDRGLLIGMRTFGKGIVQTQMKLPDNSAIRIAIAKYYTPSGRCIQKPYNDKSHEEYDHEIMQRFESGEIYDADKIKFPDSLKFKTSSGRVVYGGGGIMPDIFVPQDTSQVTDLYIQLRALGLITDFAYKYADKHSEIIKNHKTGFDYAKNYQVSGAMVQELMSNAQELGIKYTPQDLSNSNPIIKNTLKALIGRRFFGDDGFYPVLHQEDKMLLKAIKFMPVAKKLEQTGKVDKKLIK